MRPSFAAIALALLLLAPAHSQPSVRAEPTESSGLMIAIQLRHTKLWFAGKFGNWKLATYELDLMENALDQAMRLSSGGAPDAIAKQASSLRASIEAKNFGEFTKGFTALTGACNACHRATGHEFITVGVPAYSPYPDQIFDDLKDALWPGAFAGRATLSLGTNLDQPPWGLRGLILSIWQAGHP